MLTLLPSEESGLSVKSRVRRGENRRRRSETERAKRLNTGDRLDWLKGREIVNEVEHWRVLQHYHPIQSQVQILEFKKKKKTTLKLEHN